jgi:putative toxin-antitoxin system antitoxin component (TIGR02293 family)
MEAEAVLGLKKRDTSLIQKGLPFRALRRFQETSGLTLSKLAEVLDIPKRTITHRSARGVLSPSESDRLYRGARIFAMAINLFEGNQSAAREWMAKPEIAFQGRTPLEMIGTDMGAQEVAALIGRLEDGIPA